MTLPCDCPEVTGIIFVLIALIIFVCCGAKEFIVTWLILTSTQKLLWSVPVIQEELDIWDFSKDKWPQYFYTRQVYVNAELAILTFIRLFLVPSHRRFEDLLTNAYFWAGVTISFYHLNDQDSIYYRIHDALGLLLALLWARAPP